MNTIDIAIVGMSCYLPSANSLMALREQIFNPLKGSRVKVRFDGGWSDSFNHEFFRISKQESGQMDPQQKLFLALAQWAFEDAHIPVHDIPGNTGVYVGASSSEFLMEAFASGAVKAEQVTGFGNAFIANRVSHFFNLNGPSMILDAACCSSFMAVKQAVAALTLQEVDIALCGGVNVLMSETANVCLEKAGLVSQSGQSRPFSHGADGYVRGEGGCAVVLKRLADAERDQDQVYAVIRGITTNHNGTSLTLVSPNIQAQNKLYQQAYRRISAGQLTYVESSANGSKLSDLAEYRALDALAKTSQLEQQLKLGTSKGHFGNLEAASGMLSLVKTALITKARKIPAQDIPEPIVAATSHLSVNFDSAELPESLNWLMGVNSFGLGGANSHITLSPGPQIETSNCQQSPTSGVLLLSANSGDALRKLCQQFIIKLDQIIEFNSDLVDQFSKGKLHYPNKLSIKYTDKTSLLVELQNYLSGKDSSCVESNVIKHPPYFEITLLESAVRGLALKKLYRAMGNTPKEYEISGLLSGVSFERLSPDMNLSELVATTHPIIKIYDDFGDELIEEIKLAEFASFEEFSALLFHKGFLPFIENGALPESPVNQPLLYPIY